MSCGAAHLCQPLAPARRKQAKLHREVSGQCHWCSPDQIDWDAVTILTSGGVDATYWPRDEMLCAAHRAGVPFLINYAMLDSVRAAPGPSVPYSASADTLWYALSPNATARKEWAENAVFLLSHYPNGTARSVAADGISFDWELYGAGAVNANGTFGGDAQNWYVPLMSEVKRAMRASSGGDGMMISWDVTANASRFYSHWNWSGLAEIDNVYLMSYSALDVDALRGQFSIGRPPGYAHGLTAPQALRWSVLSESGIGSMIPKEQLVLGIAWYQPRWVCAGSGPYPGPCPLAADQTDSAAVDFSQVAPTLGNHTVRLDNATSTFFIDVDCPSAGTSLCSGWTGPSGPAQIFFDDPRTLTAKYEIAAQLGLRGIGPYDLADLEWEWPANSFKEPWAQDMWKALQRFALGAKSDDEASSGPLDGVAPASPWGGGYMINTSPLAAPPLVGCPLCPDDAANARTGSCSCPPGFELVQPIATISDCAAKAAALQKTPPLRPAALGLCLPFGFGEGAAFGGAFQVDVTPAAGDAYRPFASGPGCRSPNLLTGSCSCPDDFDVQNFTAAATATVPTDGDVEIAHTTVGLCLPKSGRRGGFGGAFQKLDKLPHVETPCAHPNRATSNCSCPDPGPGLTAAPLAVRIVTHIPGSGEIVGSELVLCGEIRPPSLAEGLATATEVCAGVSVDSTGVADASSGIQTCLERAASAATKRVALPPGTYLLQHTLQINETIEGITISTAGVPSSAPGCGLPGGPQCAVLRADVDLTERYGLLYAHDTTLTLVRPSLPG